MYIVSYFVVILLETESSRRRVSRRCVRILKCFENVTQTRMHAKKIYDSIFYGSNAMAKGSEYTLCIFQSTSRKKLLVSNGRACHRLQLETDASIYII